MVVGGGPTGVELAGALAEIRAYVLRRDFRHIDPRDATVVLVEGSPRLITGTFQPARARPAESAAARPPE